MMVSLKNFYLIMVLCCSASLQAGTSTVNNKSISFYQCTDNQYIFCESGSESIANEIADSLNPLKSLIEDKQLTFVVEPKFFTYQSVDSFVENTGGMNVMKAVVIDDAVHISPAIYAFHEFTDHSNNIKRIVVHELSHLNLLQNYGEETFYKIPSWFHEGLATFVSGGAGAETVTAAQAGQLLKEGVGLSPDKDFEFPTKSRVLKINPHIYYKQAEGFVSFIYDLDPIKFKRLIAFQKKRSDFHGIFFDIYQMNISDVWRLYYYRILKEY